MGMEKHRGSSYLFLLETRVEYFFQGSDSQDGRSLHDRLALRGRVSARAVFYIHPGGFHGVYITRWIICICYNTFMT